MEKISETRRSGSGLEDSWQSVRLVFPFFRQYRVQLVLGFLSLLAVNGLQLVIPRIIKHAVDSLQQAGISQTGLL